MTATCIRVRTLRIDIAARRRRQSGRGPSRGRLQAYREGLVYIIRLPAKRARDEPHPRDLSRVSLPYQQAAKRTLRSKHSLGPPFFLSFFLFDEEKARTKRVDDTEKLAP